LGSDQKYLQGRKNHRLQPFSVRRGFKDAGQYISKNVSATRYLWLTHTKIYPVPFGRF